MDHSEERLRRALDEELNAMSGETELFRSLHESFPARLRAVREVGGGYTNFLISHLRSIEKIIC